MKNQTLSERIKQPGDDSTYILSEDKVWNILNELDKNVYEVIKKPKDLSKWFHNINRQKNERTFWGIIPDFSIQRLDSKLKIFLEVKKQEDKGNAHERACKHYTTQFTKSFKDFMFQNYDIKYNFHPFFTIFCDELATKKQYTIKSEYFIESDHYLNWADYNKDLFTNFLNKILSNFEESIEEI
jgi:hypothetical protein